MPAENRRALGLEPAFQHTRINAAEIHVEGEVAAIVLADVASIADGFHPDVRAEFPFAPPGMPASQTGHNAVVAAFRDGRASIAEITIAPTSMRWCPDDSVLVVEAKGKGRLMNGADYNNSYVFFIGVRDGRVILWREYFNSLIIQRALEHVG